MKTRTHVAALLALGTASVVYGGTATYDGAGRVVSPGHNTQSGTGRDVQAPENRPRGLLLPAVQKAAPHQQNPEHPRDRQVQDRPEPVGKAMLVVRKPKPTDPAPRKQLPTIKLTTRKAGEGQ